MQYVYVKLE